MSNDKPTAEGKPLDPHTLRVVLGKLNRAANITQARAAVALELLNANPRARVVVLPEPDEIDDSFAAWDNYAFRASRVVEPWVSYPSGNTTPEIAAQDAARLLAAAEFAGGGAQ